MQTVYGIYELGEVNKSPMNSGKNNAGTLNKNLNEMDKFKTKEIENDSANTRNKKTKLVTNILSSNKTKTDDKGLNYTWKDDSAIGNFNRLYKNGHNEGELNTGTLNAGDLNTGDYNIGNFNSGSRNEGDFNTGNFNIGFNNAGDWNCGDGCTGVFCTEEAHINFFDKPSELTLTEWRKSEACRILMRARTTLWVPEAKMSASEKLENPSYAENGGYLKTCSIKEAFKILWANLSPDEQKIILDLPNFDPKIFLNVTGVKV